VPAKAAIEPVRNCLLDTPLVLSLFCRVDISGPSFLDHYFYATIDLDTVRLAPAPHFWRFYL
jgi:hypothetical protein